MLNIKLSKTFIKNIKNKKNIKKYNKKNKNKTIKKEKLFLGGNEIPNIAIFFSGRIKSFHHKKNTFTKEKELYKPIYFMSLNQKEEDDISKDFKNLFGITDDRINYEETKTPKEIFNLKKRNETSYENCYSQFYHNYSCFKLIEKYQNNNNVKFDVIVKYRSDIDTDEILPIDIPKINTIYLPEGEDFLGLNDKIAYGNYDTMKIYCDLVNNIIKMCTTQDTIYNPEILVKKHISNNNLNISRFKYNTLKLFSNRK
jgi:hypothetical protein